MAHAGLLVAACVNRAPEGLLGAAVADVGVLDLLKVIIVSDLTALMISLTYPRLARSSSQTSP